MGHPQAAESFQMCVGHETCATWCTSFNDCRECNGNAFTSAGECEAGCNFFEAALVNLSSGELVTRDPAAWLCTITTSTTSSPSVFWTCNDIREQYIGIGCCG